MQNLFKKKIHFFKKKKKKKKIFFDFNKIIMFYKRIIKNN